MAISNGIRAPVPYLVVDGQQFLVAHASVAQEKTRKSATFDATVAMSLQPGGSLETLFAGLGENSAQIIVTMGNGGVSATLIDGEIDTVTFDYMDRTIAVSGRCKSAKLHATKAHEKWTNKRPDEIVRDLAGRVGLSTDIDQSLVKAGKLVQIDFAKMSDGASYATVLHKLAELDGAIWWVNGGVLHFKSAASNAGVYTVNYAAPQGQPVTSDALKLTIRRNIQAAKTAKVTVKSWNERKKQVVTSTKTVAGVPGTTTYGYHIPNLDQQHADKHAHSRAKGHVRHEFSPSVTLVGDPTIDVSMMLRITGTAMDQDFEIDSIRHELGINGYSMSIEAKGEKTGRTPK